MAGRRRSHRSRHSNDLHAEFEYVSTSVTPRIVQAYRLTSLSIWLVHGIQGTETSTGARRVEWWQRIQDMMGPNKTTLLEYNHRLGTRYSLSEDSITLSANHLLGEIHEQLRTAQHNVGDLPSNRHRGEGANKGTRIALLFLWDMKLGEQSSSGYAIHYNQSRCLPVSWLTARVGIAQRSPPQTLKPCSQACLSSGQNKNP
jgi:hypothetical protein